MEPVQAIILGIIQGLTEFLPVSSSGHLVLFQHLFGLEEPELFFNISVHVGTLVAVVIFFRKEIQSIIVSLARFSALLFKREASFDDAWKDADVKLALLIVIGSIPTAFIGLMLHKVTDIIFSSIFLVGCALIVTGLVLWGTRWIKEEEDAPDFTIKNALVIGVVQGMAIIPGISRSGSTIVAGLFLGLSRETAARYSFLLSIPAIVGAEILSLREASLHALDGVTILGTITAGIVGYCALKLLVYIVKAGQMHLFSPYCWIVGIIALIWGW